MKPFELKAMTYEEARREHFTLLMKKAKRKMDYWSARLDKTRPDNLMDEAHIKASDAGWEYNFYKDALEALEEMPKWISVEESLPDEGSRVFVALCHDDRYYLHTATYNNLGWWLASFKQEDITHWMPLPKLWEEET